MKKFLVPLFLLLFLSCSNEGFESKVAAPPQKDLVYCTIMVEGELKCVQISESLCTEMKGVRGKCNIIVYVSSSSDEDVSSSSSSDIVVVSSSSDVVVVSSSSATVGDGSSSSVGGSSSSVGGGDTSSSSDVGGGDVSSNSGSAPNPITTGSLTLKDVLSGGNYYSIGTTLTPAFIESTVEITNKTEALCGDITNKWKSSNTAAVGTVEAVAVATCNGKEVELKNVTATIVANPSLSDCVLPSTYLHKGDILTNLATINDNYGRCTVDYDVASFSPSSSSVSKPPVGATLPLTNYSGKTITVRAQAKCTGVTTTPSPKNCPATAAAVAENYVQFTKDDDSNPKELFSKGFTVIGMKMTITQTGIGCEYSDSNQNGKPNVVFYITTPAGRVGSEGSPTGKQPWWTTLTPMLPANYTSNGNRILFETQNEGLQCKPYI